MRAAFSIWDQRIAPVFDTSDQICLIDFQSGNILERSRVLLPNDPPAAKITRLAEYHIDLLVCGAISGVLNGIIESYGIEIIPFVSGEIDDLAAHLLSGEPDWSEFAMPGCTVGRTNRRRKRRRGKGGALPL